MLAAWAVAAQVEAVRVPVAVPVMATVDVVAVMVLKVRLVVALVALC